MDDNDVRDGWASASVRLDSPDLTRLNLPTELLEMADSRGRNPRVLVLPIPNADRLRMENLLIRLKTFLRDHLQTFEALREVEIDIFLGWSPKAPQESLQVDAELIRILARLDAPIVFDTYSA